MMKISTKGRYGVRAMGELALHYGEGPIPLKLIAENQGISEAYLEQLLGVLRKQSLVKTIRGPQGGYVLSESPEHITVGDVLRALEGPFAPVDCVSENHPECCNRATICLTRSIWMQIRDSITDIVDHITLQDLVKKNKALMNTEMHKNGTSGKNLCG